MDTQTKKLMKEFVSGNQEQACELLATHDHLRDVALPDFSGNGRVYLPLHVVGFTGQAADLFTSTLAITLVKPRRIMAWMNVPLSEITWAMTEKVTGDPKTVLEARLPGGATATTHSIDGWKVAKKKGK